MNKAGLSSDYIPLLLQSSTLELFRKYFASELAAKVAKMLFRCHLQTNLNEIKQNKTQVRESEVELYLLEEAQNLLNDLVSRNSNGTRLWKIINAEIFDKTKLNLSLDDLHIGYFLSSLFKKLGLQYNFEYFDTQRKFFQEPEALDKRFIKGFKTRIWQYDYSFIERYRKVNELVQLEPNAEGLDTFVELLNLSEHKIPTDMKRYEELTMYLANFIPPEFLQTKEFTHLDLYSDALELPPNTFTIKMALMACKWSIKLKKEPLAFELFEKASDTMAFWGGEYHPLLSEFLDFFT